MEYLKYNRLVRRGLLNRPGLEDIERQAKASGAAPEELMLERGVPKHEILLCLSEYYGLPFVEFEESVIAPHSLLLRLDLEKLRRGLWFPLSVRGRRAEVIAYLPDDPQVSE